jgi:hypothetical protein
MGAQTSRRLRFIAIRLVPSTSNVCLILLNLHPLTFMLRVCLTQLTIIGLLVPFINAITIRPVSRLTIANAQINPDGYSRSYVFPYGFDASLSLRSTVLAGGTFPGPVIRGQKGDRFQLLVVNDLTDSTMDRSTSIVCLSAHWHPCFPTLISLREALAWDLAERDELGRWYGIHHAMSYYSEGLVSV